MEVSVGIPIIYTERVLIPGFIMKITLPLEENFGLLKYIQDSDSLNKELIGLIPKRDANKVDDVIGTLGVIQKIFQYNSDPKELDIMFRGVCRFKLGETISEKPFKINSVKVINNFKQLSGDEKKTNELLNEFDQVIKDFLSKSRFNSGEKSQIRAFLNTLPLHSRVYFCLSHLIVLTTEDAYKILTATNLNNVLKHVIKCLKLKIIEPNAKNCFSGLLPVHIVRNDVPSMVSTNLISGLTKDSSALQGLRTTITGSKLPPFVHKSIMNEFSRLQNMHPSSPDYSLALNYINYVVNLPWNKNTIETLDFEKAKKVLQSNHHGMTKVKQRILQFIAVRILNPERRGPILCFIGPPGVGKTTIAKTIADSLNRTFKRISLGGINSFSDIKGHRKTYIGAMPGCIIHAISQAQTNNPIILLDEIDKMYKGANGDPAAALLEVLDPEQNSSFVDSFINLPFNLSQVMFVSTANNVKGIPQTLRDRMEIIYLEGYALDEKMQIADNYLIPKILNDHKMDDIPINFTQSAIKTIIQNYTQEAGVRELQRKIEAICHYIAVEVVENGDKKMKNYVITPEFLMDVFGSKNYSTKNTLVEQLKLNKQIGVAIGLVWTPVGGQVQVIETSYHVSGKNNKRLVLTGLAGKSLSESVEIAFNWIELFAMKNNLDINNYVVHVHFPVGGCHKDGPSAGITIACALISLFWNIPLNPMIAMTGEISLQGFVLPVGGVKEKILAAYNSGIRTVIIPKQNVKDTKSLSANVQEDMNIVPVTHMKEVLDVVIPGGLSFLRNPTSNMIMPKSKI